MSLPAIEVSGLSKRYVIQHESRHDNLRDTLHHSARKLWRKYRWGTSFDTEEFWALRDVSFAVQPGEVVGIIGRNGAGKSTLLKILSRITEPTSGKVSIRGRVASLLEVGTGFHPELSGRENIYLNGAILGMSRVEIRKKFDEIVAFAEVEKFLDTPVKRYSSGMYVRLAFAVAAHLDPEILIVDEVLAVGDAQFQKKCLGKISDVARAGRTVLFVSHDINSITTLTQRCILMENGRVCIAGRTHDVVGRYFSSALAPATYHVPAARPTAHIESISVVTSESDGLHAMGKPLRVKIVLAHPIPVAEACFSFQIVNQRQQAAVHAWVYHTNHTFAHTPGKTVLECEFPSLRLNVGRYTLNAYFTEPPGRKSIDILDQVCGFEIVNLNNPVLWGWRSETCVYHDDTLWHVRTQT